MMLADLRQLLEHLPGTDVGMDDISAAILDQNCLGKRSTSSRQLTLRHLRSLYSLDHRVTIYRALRYFWQRDVDGQPLLALQIAYARDPILRLSAPAILRLSPGDELPRTTMDQFLDSLDAGRFSKATLKSISQNVGTTWTHAGHLKGHARKFRSSAAATPGSVSLALLLGYLCGARGERLFESEYAKLLNCPLSRKIELGEVASRRGWIVLKHVGSIVEVLFPGLLTDQEQEWVREQG